MKKTFEFFKELMSGSLGWVATSLSIWTLVFSPVAMGRAAERQFDQITQAELKQLVMNLGLNKKQTYKEFWEKTKHLYPARVHRDVEATFLSQPSALMPRFDVTTSVDSSGRKIPTLKIVDRGTTVNVQILGELNQWAKVNGVTLTESDLQQLKPAIEKLNPFEIQLETYKKDFSRFSGYPRMTPELWKSLKPAERARYIVEMRLLWFDARRVIETMSPSARVEDALNNREPNSTPGAQPGRKPKEPGKPSGKKRSSIEELYKILFGEEAHAQSSAVAEADRLVQTMSPLGYGGKECSPRGSTSSSAKGCVVAGQVARDGAKYYTAVNSNSTNGEPRCACNYHAVLVQRYTAAPPAEKERAAQYLLQQAEYNKVCTQSKSGSGGLDGVWVACNPVLYSFNPNTGDPYCVNSKLSGFQNATAYSSGVSRQPSCDEQSRLGPDPIAFGRTNVRADRAAAMNVMASDKDSEKMTMQYLEGLLKQKQKNARLADGKSLAQLLADPNSSYDRALDDFLVDAQIAFEGEITEAMRLCTQNRNEFNPDNNHSNACDQLHRRWLFTEKVIERYRSKSCVDGSAYIGLIGNTDSAESRLEKASLNKSRAGVGTKLCKCRDGRSVGFGEKCTQDPGNRQPAELAACPGTSQIYGTETCRCSDGKEFIRTESEKENIDEYLRVCHAGDRDAIAGTCDIQYPGASPLNPESCLCESGSRKGELPVKMADVYDRSPKVSKTTTSSETSTTFTDSVTVPAVATPVSTGQYTCDQKGFPWWGWLIGALAVVGIYKLFKRDDKPKNETCAQGPNWIYNPQLKYCYCPWTSKCPAGGVNADCSGCTPQPTCLAPKSAGTYPNCTCPSTCAVGMNHPVTCACEEGRTGVNPDNNGGGLPPDPQPAPVGR